MRKYFTPSPHPAKAELDALLDTIYWHNDYFSYIAHIPSGRYFHISPSFETLTGFTKEEIEEKNVAFFIEHMPPEDVLRSKEEQVIFFRKPLEPGFDFNAPLINEFFGRLRTPDGQVKSCIGLATTLKYLPTREMENSLVLNFVDQKNDLHNSLLRKEAKAILTKVKQLYTTIYPATSFQSVDKGPLTELVFEVDPKHVLTRQEKTILNKIAQGETTKKIATDLSISINTVETHRKNMLIKLESKNVAELVKKASKLYWLD
ncbi:MAG: LuxR C-terminal-related transcriptional regulator [Bacteroidota bacterium]